MSASAVGGLKSGLKSVNSQGVPSRSVTIADGDAGGQTAPSRPRERHGGQGKAKEEVPNPRLSSHILTPCSAAEHIHEQTQTQNSTQKLALTIRDDLMMPHYMECSEPRSGTRERAHRR